MNFLALIPPGDLETKFARLPGRVKAEYRLWAACMEALARARHGQGVGVCSHFARRLGVSVDRVRTKWTEWRQGNGWYEGGDWRLLVNHARAGWKLADDGGEKIQDRLHVEFIEFWKSLCEGNQRACEPAHRQLVRQWQRWCQGDGSAAIPGYPECPRALAHTGLPEGWSYRNLMRHRPNNYELTAARIGRAAASEERLQVFTSRVGLKVGQYYEFDDLEFDLKVNFVGQTKAMRPRMLAALDVFSACEFSQGFKPTLWNEECKVKNAKSRNGKEVPPSPRPSPPGRGRKEALKEIDMMWLVVSVLTMHGYRTDEVGTTLVVEHGTAAIRSEFEERILAATNGHVKIERSGKFGRATFAGLFEGQSKGNFRFKASREGLFNLWHNELASLPGQVGKDRDHSPEQNYGLERYNERLLQAAALLSPEKAALLKFPVLEWNQFLGCALEAVRNMNARTEHDLQGWIEAGLVTREWRLAEDQSWQGENIFLSLPAERQEMARAILVSTPALARSRKLSPAEVWRDGQAELTKLPVWCYPELVGEKEGRELVLQGGLFEFRDRELGPDKLRYRGEGAEFIEGESYLCFVNPFNARLLVACHHNLAVAGVCELWDAPCRADQAAVQEKLGEAVKWEAAALRQLGLRHTSRALAKAEMHAQNAVVMGASPMKEEGKPRVETVEPGAFEDLESRSESETVNESQGLEELE